MFIAFRLVVKKLVDEELMIIDVDAKMFVVNRLANLFNVVPILYRLSCSGSISVTVDEPSIDRVFRVVEPVTVRFEMVVVARDDVPETESDPPTVNAPVVEAVDRLVLPDTNRSVTVVEARVEVPFTVRLPVTVVVPIVAVLITAFVVVELITVKPVILAIVENRLVIVPVVALKADANRLVDVAFVVVELVTVNPAISAIVATRDEINELVVVEFTNVAEVANRLVDVVFSRLVFVAYRVFAVIDVADALFTANWLGTFRLVIVDEDIVVVAKVVSPNTSSDPYNVVAPVTASVDDAVNAPVKNPVVPVIAPRLAVVEYRLLAVNAVDEAVFSIVWPVTYRLLDSDRFVADALFRVVWPSTLSVPEALMVVAELIVARLANVE